MGGSVKEHSPRRACGQLSMVVVVAVAVFQYYDEKGAKSDFGENVSRLKVLDLFSSVRTQNR